ncbi:putative cell surface protein [Escherichia coli 3-020-07_S4_C2]|nr:putative cell surface protein [Escherichia coli 3-020-07_S4_C2]
MKFCAGATFITGFNGSGYSDAPSSFIACSSGMAAQIKTLLILF